MKLHSKFVTKLDTRSEDYNVDSMPTPRYRSPVEELRIAARMVESASNKIQYAYLELWKH